MSNPIQFFASNQDNFTPNPEDYDQEPDEYEVFYRKCPDSYRHKKAYKAWRNADQDWRTHWCPTWREHLFDNYLNTLPSIEEIEFNLPPSYTDPVNFWRYYDRFVRPGPKHAYKRKKLTRYRDKPALWYEPHYHSGPRVGQSCSLYADLINDHLMGNHWVAQFLPKYTRQSCIDLDAHDYQKIGGEVFLTLEYFKKIKLIYDNFPGRIWCISSNSLGMHIWETFDQQRSTLEIHKRDKAKLANLGLPSVEVHPMQGRAFRKPFGLQYQTFTAEGNLLDTWQEQMIYFLDTPGTPKFANIVTALLIKGNASLRNSRHPEEYAADWNREIEKVIDWVNSGAEVTRADFQHEREKNNNTLLSMFPLFEQSSTQKTKLKDHQSDIDLQDFRGGNWPLKLEQLAKHGLPCEDSANLVIPELVKWLYWVELYNQPQEQRARNLQILVWEWLKKKHNGHSSRYNRGEFSKLKAQIRSAIKSAKRINDDGKYILANLRQKRDQGKYKRVILLAPLMADTSQALTQEKNNNTLLSMFPLLPPNIKAKLKTKKQQNFALNLINYLAARKFSTNIHTNKLKELAGTKSAKSIDRWKHQLRAAGIISFSSSYSSGSHAIRYRLTKWVKSELQKAQPHHQSKTA